jgi:hypothetical protein
MRHHAPLRLALALLLPALMAMPAASAGTDRVLTIDTDSAHPAHAFKAFDGDPLKVFDFNGDGRKEIIAQNDNRFVYIFDSKTGTMLSELTTTYPPNWGARSINGPEAAIMVHGGVPHLVLGNSAAFITDFAFDPAHSSSTHFAFVKKWERHLDDCHQGPGMDAKPTLGDANGDGKLEIFAQTEETGVYALRNDGSLLWKKCIGGGNGEPTVGDLDNDGKLDAVFASDGGIITATNAATGATKWTFNVNHLRNFGAGSMPEGPTIAQLDGSGSKEVLVGVRDSHDCSNFSNNHAALVVLHGNGQLDWWTRPSDAAPLTYMHPVVADTNGDGKPEVFWGDWNTQGHKCGNWEVVGTAHAYSFTPYGGLRWKTALNSWWSNKDFALAELTGSGPQDLLANGPSSDGGHDGMWYLDSNTGAKEKFIDAFPWKVQRGPVVADLWGTGTAQWVIPVSAFASGTSGGGIQVYDTHLPYKAAWPHLPYPNA